MEINGIIRQRNTVKLNKAQCKNVEQFYDSSVVDDTIVERITYMSDGLKINGFIARPKKEGVYPVLIWNRGGAEDKGALDNLRAYLILASTARWGYVVLASQYRGNMGSEGNDEWGGGDLDDILALIETAKNLPECDETRIAIEGASRGGMNSYRALLEYPDFKCAMIHAGITDAISLVNHRQGFREYLAERYEGLDGDELIGELKKVSAIHFADKLPLSVPILIMHGAEDHVIPLEQSEWLVQKLLKFNHPHEFVIIPEGTHVALKDGTYKEIDRYRKSFLDHHMR